jgi:hypothetical protein
MTNLPGSGGFFIFIFSICCSQKSNDRCKNNNKFSQNCFGKSEMSKIIPQKVVTK